MPGMSGFEVCGRLKNHEKTRDIPVIFVSAAREVEKAVEGLRLGAVDFICKPYRPEEMLARVHTHLELSRLRADLEARVAERTGELRIANDQLQRDISERVRIEEALRESEERFRNMADTAPVMLWVSGTDKRCTFFNKVWLSFRGRSLEEEFGDGWAEGVHPDDARRCLDTYSSAFDARRDFQMEYRLQRADGEYRWVLDRGTARFMPGNVFAGYIGSCIDVTDLKRNQEQLLATQKLESLGVLAAGIAHDFNNMLSSISAEAELALSQTSPDSPLRESFDLIATVAMRGSEVLNQIMDYAGDKNEQASWEPVDLSSLITEMMDFLKVSISKRASFTAALATDLPLIRANSTQIRRLVMNLLTNASEALEDREGSVRVATSNCPVDARLSQHLDLPEGIYALLEVTDAGHGMTEQERSKIFDPFYTTKSAGRGLGLSAVQGIIRSHAGAIQVESTPGKGSTFKVYLPYDNVETNRTEEAPPIFQDKPSSRAETVLVVEDEETLRSAVSISLQKNGFSVLSAGDGHTAVHLFRAHAADIQIVLLDLTLPGLSGAEALAEMRRMKPDVNVVVTSAYDWNRVSEDFPIREDDLVHFIRKPYRISQLLLKLRQALVQDEIAVNHRPSARH
jgi:PAS domain S-box-containing protein